MVAKYFFFIKFDPRGFLRWISLATLATIVTGAIAYRASTLTTDLPSRIVDL